MYAFNSYGHQEYHILTYCNRLTTVQDIQVYLNIIFLCTVYIWPGKKTEYSIIMRD